MQTLQPARPSDRSASASRLPARSSRVPKLVVADEAVSALDLSVQAQILKLILDWRNRNGLTVLFHPPQFGSDRGDRGSRRRDVWRYIGETLGIIIDKPDHFLRTGLWHRLRGCVHLEARHDISLLTA